jgi:hypothetical protein
MSLKVFNLQCDAGHLFEGWFGSHEDYNAQQARGLVTCPMCHSPDIHKMPSAPRINSSRTLVPIEESQMTGSASGSVPTPVATSPELLKLQAQVLTQMRQVISSAENVGPAFAREARAIHEGEAQPRSIRGTATQEEREELAEDGISVMMVPDILADDRLQ